MAIVYRRTLNQRINSSICYLAQRTTRLFGVEFPEQRISCSHCTEILGKTSPKRLIAGLWKVATFALLMSASSVVTAYGLSIPDDPTNDSVVVRLETTSINPRNSAANPGDTDITNWWVQAGSTGFGSGQSDYFSSGELEAPAIINMNGTADLPQAEIQGGTGNALVTNLPLNGDLVFLSVWLKRQDQPWERELISVITSASSTTLTTIVENNRYGYSRFFFGDYVWGSASMASWYQLWVNNDEGINVHNKWYSHKEVCMNNRRDNASDCATDIPFTLDRGSFWVRAWSVHGGYGPWSQPAAVDFELLKDEL